MSLKLCNYFGMLENRRKIMGKSAMKYMFVFISFFVEIFKYQKSSPLCWPFLAPVEGCSPQHYRLGHLGPSRGHVGLTCIKIDELENKKTNIKKSRQYVNMVVPNRQARASFQVE